jgi:hypothetical protein
MVLSSSLWCLWPNIRFLPSTVTEKNATKNILDGRKDRRTEIKQYTPLPLSIDKHIYNNNQSLNVYRVHAVNRRYCYRTLYPPFWIYERLPITLYISIKTYYLVFILLEIVQLYWGREHVYNKSISRLKTGDDRPMGNTNSNATGLETRKGDG